MKVLDDKKRLETTLLHELCHVAAFLIDGEFKPPHGASFRRWADRAERVLGYVVTTCHNYDIFTPHKFKCVNDTCGQVYGRHSKKGIRVESQICGCCRGKLEYQGVFDVDGKVIKMININST
jgi:predicted SprT family Zn-dependent metalloprotease